LLLNDLYIIQSLTQHENLVQAEVLLNADHPIFKGHFPGHPVLPGVCMLEMISEISGQCHRGVFMISAGPMIKFLQMIDPGKNPVLYFEINYQFSPETVFANGKIFFGSVVFMKFQLSLIQQKGS
jgi:3-hydroxyacyl-[acyl-carrier-protein] dehydratase